MLVLWYLICGFAFICSFLLACIDDPDEEREMPNIPYPKWTWLYRSFYTLLLGSLVVATALVYGILAVSGEELPHHSNPWLLSWIPSTCCVTNDCCWEVSSTELRPYPEDRWQVVSTGQIKKRTDWSPDGKYYRCACDFDPKSNKWIRHQGADTRCVFVPMQSSWMRGISHGR